MGKGEVIEEMAEKFNKDARQFIIDEAFGIYYKTDDEGIALEALKLLERVTL